MAMRRRGPGEDQQYGYNEPDTPGKSPKGLGSSKVLKKMDVFTKVHDDFRVQTSNGVAFSLVSLVVALLLVLTEFNAAFINVGTKEHLVVDTSLGDKLHISMNITFHSLTCSEVHVDAMDVAGDNQMRMEHSMLKQRLTPGGVPIGEAFTEDPTDFAAKKSPGKGEAKDTYCGPCYGSETEARPCCNTCEEVLQAYSDKGWQAKTIKQTASQCGKGFSSKQVVQPGEGCNLNGFMSVNKVAGNFHIAFGDSVVKDGRHIHQFVPSEAPGFNVSHTIHHISFGAEYPGRLNPLDDKVKYVSESVGTGLYQYFIKVIPTNYKGTGRVIRTNRISVTERFKPLHKEGEALLKGDSHAHQDQTSVLPGVFFIYELSPFSVEIASTRVPVTHFLTKLCAIAGGVFAMASTMDSFLYYSGWLVTKSSGFISGTPR